MFAMPYVCLRKRDVETTVERRNMDPFNTKIPLVCFVVEMNTFPFTLALVVACATVVRVTEKVDLSTTVKFVYMHFEGPNLSFVKKGRYAVVRGHVTDKYFSPSHVDFTCITDPSEITDALIMQKVADARCVFLCSLIPFPFLCSNFDVPVSSNGNVSCLCICWLDICVENFAA